MLRMYFDVTKFARRGLLPSFMEGEPGGEGEGGAGEGGGTAVAEHWCDDMGSQETRDWVKAKGYKNPGEALDGHRNLETMVGSKIDPPTDDWGDEQWGKFNEQMAGKSINDYHFPVPEGGEQAFPEARINQIKELCIAKGIHPHQANEVMKDIIAFDVQALANVEAEAAKIVAADHETLKEDWKEQYDANDVLQKRGWEQAAKSVGVESDVLQAFMKETGFDTHPIMKKIGLAVQNLFKDATVVGGDNAGSGDQGEGGPPSVLGKGFYDKTDE